MICPKCKKTIPDNATVCPFCKKVLALVCPICGTHNDNSTCSKCSYVILSKCTQCGIINKTEDKFCRKCRTSTTLSAAKRLTENENCTAITVSLGNVNKLSKSLGEKKLLTKFLFKIKTMITSFAKEINAYVLMPTETTFLINLTEYSTDYSAAQKAVKASIKLLNIICNLNRTLRKELMFSLEVRITVEQKRLEDFFSLIQNADKIKLLDLYSGQSADAKGLQFIADQYIYQLIRKEYPMDSLYSTERDGNVVAYYSLDVSKYLVPAKKEDIEPDELNPAQMKIVTKKETDYEQELYKKSIEGIKVNCKFEQIGAEKVFEYIKEINFTTGNRIISLRANPERLLPTKLVSDTIRSHVPCYTVICTEDTTLKPWEFFKNLVSEIYENAIAQFSIGYSNDELIKALQNLTPPRYDSAETARLAYIEAFIALLSFLPQSVIYIENFHHIDIASRHVLEEIFNKITDTKLSFIITNDRDYALQKNIPDLLNSYYYTEIFVGQMDITTAITQQLESDDFKESFFHKKIVDNAGASYLYCTHAINYLKDSGVLVNFNDKLVITDAKTVIIPFDIESLINTRLKRMSKEPNKSLVLAYSYLLGPVINLNTLQKLGLNISENINSLIDSGFIDLHNNKIYIQNYEVLRKCFKATLKPEVLKYLAGNLLTKVFTGNDKDYAMILSLDYLENYSLEFSKLYEFSITTLQFGDYDTYLKMCIKLLKLLKILEKDIAEDEISEYQADFYNNLTQLLYRYAPERIYPIAEALLQKAIENNDDEKIKTLSNMMLQGGLLTSNYTNTLTLIQNILERTENCRLVDAQGNANNKVFALSLVSIEIYFHLGYYDKCIKVCEDLLSILTPDKLSSLKPSVLTKEQFISHISESFIYYLLSSFLTGSKNISEIINTVQASLGMKPDGAAEIANIAKIITGESHSATPFSNNENAELFAKLYKSFADFNGDFGVFAANIYEFKKVAVAQSKTPYILLGDLLVGYSYKTLGALGKAEHIFNNVYAKAKQSSLYFIVHLTAFFIADLAIAQTDYQLALQTITNSITVMERSERPLIFILYMLKKLLVEISNNQDYSNIDVSSEKGFIEQIEIRYPGITKILNN